MTITDKDYALLDRDSYLDHKKDDPMMLGGVSYIVFDTYSDPITGYHGTAYQRMDTHEVVIVHRGTEKNWGVIQDGPTDLGMVVTGFNAQLPDARAFTQRVMEYADKEARNKHWPVQVTTTGHSLGGTLAQIIAHENHLRGVTFNAYGAVDLQHDIPEGGSRVTNYVRATDVVSAASRHYGTVHVLATTQDVHNLSHAGYDDQVTATSPRDPLSAISFAAHSIDNFAPDGLVPSDLSPENEAHARSHAQAIGLYRADIQSLRSNTLSHAWEMAHKASTARELLTSASRSALHGEFAHAGHTLELAGHRTAENLAHQRDTVITTAKLAGNAVEAMGHQAAHAVGEAYDAARDGVNQGAKMLGQKTRLVGEVMSDGVSHMADTLRHPGSWFESTSDERAQAGSKTSLAEPNPTTAPESLEARLDRMIAAADREDWDSFREDTQAFADMPPGRELRAQAIATVDREEQLAAQHQVSMSQMQPAASVLLDHPAHPGHAMFQQSLQGVRQLNAEHHIAPSERDTRFAGALTAAAMKDGLSRIDKVVLGTDAQYAFAAQGEPTSASWKIAQIPTVKAINTPIEQSSKQWEKAAQPPQREQEPQMARQQESPQATRHTGLSM